MFDAMLFLETAVMQTVQTNKKVPINSMIKAEIIGSSEVTMLDPNRKGGAVHQINNKKMRNVESGRTL